MTKGERAMMIDDSMTKRLNYVAWKLTPNRELQKDLVQEMCLYLVRELSRKPDNALTWYLKGCEFRARNYLKHGRSIDSQKRSTGAVRMRSSASVEAMECPQEVDQPDPGDLHGALCTDD